MTAAWTEPRLTSRIITPDPRAELGDRQERHRDPRRPEGERHQDQRRRREHEGDDQRPAEADPRVQPLGAAAEPTMLPSAPSPSAIPIAPEPRPSSRVAKSTSSAQKAVLKRLKVAVPSSAGAAAASPDEADAGREAARVLARHGRLGDLGTADEERREEEGERRRRRSLPARSAPRPAGRRASCRDRSETERLPISSELASTYSSGRPAR